MQGLMLGCQENVLTEYSDLLCILGALAYPPAGAPQPRTPAIVKFDGLHSTNRVVSMSMARDTCRVVHLGHGAPDFGALHIGDVPCPGQVQPIGLIEFGADEEVEVGDALVLSDQRRSQAQLAVRLHYADHLRAEGKQDCQQLFQQCAFLLTDHLAASFPVEDLSDVVLVPRQTQTK